MKSWRFLVGLLGFGVVSCGSSERLVGFDEPMEGDEKPKMLSGVDGPGTVGNVPKKFLKDDSEVAVGSTPVEEVGFLPSKVGEGVVVHGMLLPSDDSIVWSTDDPDADIPFDEELIKKVKKPKNWYSSYRSAKREAMRTGKPVLIWFTKSGSPGSPRCKVLNRTLFATKEFSDWANENLIRLKIDANGGSNVRGTTEKGRVVVDRKAAERLKKKYRILGYPSLIVLEPDGGVYLRDRGYQKDDKKALFGKLKDAVLTVEHQRGVWERKMFRKGYRSWSGENGQDVFAKLVKYQAGQIVLVEPNGNRIKTKMRFLSKEDQNWILAEKAKRDQKRRKKKR